MNSDSQLCTFPPLLPSSLPLSFVNRWVEVSDCDESQNGEKRERQARTYSTYTRAVTHGCIHTLSLHQTDAILCIPCCYLSPHSPPLSYLHITLCVCVCVCVCVVYSDHGLVRSDRFYYLIPVVKALYTQCAKNELRSIEVDVFFLDRETDQRE